MTGIFVKNNTSHAIWCFVSKYSGGNDEWFKLEPGKGDSWNRGDGRWELVAFQYCDDRAGVYVKAGSVVTFNGLRNIHVS
jgi:hypothetical protein